MQSIIIFGNEENTRKKVKEIVAENKISKFDQDVFTSDKTIGIADIRGIQKKIYLKPVYSDKKIVILESFLGITPDAQNAFLKVLEEPPQDTIILILVKSIDLILPTVMSRCNLIDVNTKLNVATPNHKSDISIESIINKTSNPLILAQDFGKDKETALNLLQDLIIALESGLNNNFNHSFMLKKIQKTYTLIKTTNVNIRFALENLFLNI